MLLAVRHRKRQEDEARPWNAIPEAEARAEQVRMGRIERREEQEVVVASTGWRRIEAEEGSASAFEERIE